ncbi:hypothetical protein C8F04DRAFT_1274958 [Mycena alexandri]|uniref:Uncharacterized protein n=1 Tax=Mycena alexandri TaxID=1745969 RepID=A0AAD6WPP0_9AGAR|nr:hypothetical protein C8F04DRAFT_1274958 [Mycena alexandri]
MEQRRRGDVQRLTQGVRVMRLVHERTTDLVALTARLVDARGNNADAVVLSAGCLVVHISRLYAARPRHIGRLRHAQGKMCVDCICIAPPSKAFNPCSIADVERAAGAQIALAGDKIVTFLHDKLIYRRPQLDWTTTPSSIQRHDGIAPAVSIRTYISTTQIVPGLLIVSDK